MLLFFTYLNIILLPLKLRSDTHLQNIWLGHSGDPYEVLASLTSSQFLEAGLQPYTFLNAQQNPLYMVTNKQMCIIADDISECVSI